VPDATVHTTTRAIASGDSEAFAAFYDEWFDRMYDQARRCTGRDEAFCLDVVQDAMMKVMRSIRVFEEQAALAGWLRTVVRSAAYDRLRQERRRRLREAGVAAVRAEAEASEAHAVDERLAWLRRELLQSDDPHARLLALRYRMGLTLDQIGALVGVGPGGADGRIRRALAGLRRRAEEQWDDG
jgi:RNA polymerase sigma-70 factor (ECF subfamily)